MALLRGKPPQHAKWLSAPFLSYDPYQGRYAPGPRRHVGALSPEGVLELGKQGIDLSDQIVRDLDIPVMQEALDLLDKVYWTADQLGVGPEVRTAITAIRGAEYADVAVSALLPPSAAAAGAGVFVGIGAVAALGAVGAVAAVAAAIFGGGSDEAADKARKRAQAQVLHLRDRLTVAEFAAEQDDAAAIEATLALVPYGPVSPAEHKSRAARAAKLAAFYRALPSSLSKKELALCESLSNLARWTATLRAYAQLSPPQKDGLDVMFGKSAPRLPSQLQPVMQAEAQKLSALTKAVQAERAASVPTLALLVGAAGVAAYAALNPSAAARAAKSAGSTIYQGGAAAVRKVRSIV